MPVKYSGVVPGYNLENFQKDAKNNELSYSKMLYEMDKRHPRTIINDKPKPYKYCKTKTGHYGFCCCADNERS